MIEQALGTISVKLNEIGVPYEFMQWTSPVEDRYWVGEFTEVPTYSEDGYEETTFILTGTTRKSWLTLMQDRNTIRNHFPTVNGFRVKTDNGAVVIYYENAFPVPTGEADLKRIQINLRIMAWKGMN